MKRREFIKTSALSALSLSTMGFCRSGSTGKPGFSTVVISKEDKMINSELSIDSSYLAKALDKAVQYLYNTDYPVTAWKNIVKPGEVIGLKVNCLSKRGITHIELVRAIIERLKEAGVKENDIIIWDRLNMDLDDAGYQINTSKNGIRCFGNDVTGFEYDLEVFGSAGSRLSKILTQICDGIINIPVLKDHSIAGITSALKNMFGSIHNPNKYHLNTGNPYIADVNAFPSIRKKIRLHICDAIEIQYHGGPSFMPQWRTNYGGLIVSKDPVALDTIGLDIIESKRKEFGFGKLSAENRAPLYIRTASDVNHQLGISDKKSIKVSII